MANIIKIMDGYSFMPRRNKTILEALEGEAMTLDYQCRQGFCGACQISLIQGKVEYLQEPIAFIGEGKVLACCCRPATDISIELPDTIDKLKALYREIKKCDQVE